MKTPKMIIFDYGHTLLFEPEFDYLKGEKAVFRHITRNPHGVTPEQVNDFARELFDEAEICRKNGFEMNELPLLRLKYEHFGIELDISLEEAERLLWDNASPGEIMPFAGLMLEYLKVNRIRTGVISNIGWTGKALAARIGRLLPENEFEFIIASSDYGVRKPNRLLFETALQKAELAPSQVWFCGDNFKCDVEGAHLAGIFPVFYTEKTIKSPYDKQNESLAASFDYLYIHDWRELIKILEDIKAREKSFREKQPVISRTYD